MCGRYIPNTEEEIMEIREILTEISIRISSKNFDNDDVYPSKLAPIIYLKDNQTIIDNSTFGFKKWNNEKQRIFNAKSETVAQSYFFSSFINDGHCIIPAKAYYEWKTLDNNNKEKYYFYCNEDIKLPNDKKLNMMFMLGLYNAEKNEFVILTKQADDNIADVHNRMPLILKEEYLADWLLGKIDINNAPNFLKDNIDCYIAN